MRLLDEDTAGTIVGRGPRGQWLVLLDEDQMEIPVDEAELVPLFSEDDRSRHVEANSQPIPKATQPEQTIQRQPQQEEAEELLLFLKRTQREGEMEAHLVNNTQFHLLCVLNIGRGNSRACFSHGEIRPHSHLMVGHLRTKDFDQWKHLELQLLFYSDNERPRPPFVNELQLSAKRLENARTTSSHFSGDEVHQFKLWEAHQPEEKQEPEQPGKDHEPNFPKLEAPPEVVDLHIDKIEPDHEQLQPAEILDHQMKYFILALDKAYALSYEKITFIHGLGNGILKNKIRSYVVKHKGVRKLRDADPVQYGNGATEIWFR